MANGADQADASFKNFLNSAIGDDDASAVIASGAETVADVATGLANLPNQLGNLGTGTGTWAGDPTWQNFGGVVCDGLTASAVLLPMAGVEAVEPEVEEETILPYKEMKKITKGTSDEAHHLIEKRFAKRLAVKQGDMQSVALSPTDHQEITNAWRTKIGYGNGTANATADEIFQAAREIYAERPAWLDALGLK